jgi:molecular chaperone DnaK
MESHIQEYKKTIESIIQNKDTKAAKELTEEIEGLDRELRNSVSGGLIDKNRLEYHDREFNNLQWKDKNKARQLVNQGLKLIQEGKTSQLRPLLHQIWELRIDADDDGDKDTLG